MIELLKPFLKPWKQFLCVPVRTVSLIIGWLGLMPSIVYCLGCILAIFLIDPFRTMESECYKKLYGSYASTHKLTIVALEGDFHLKIFIFVDKRSELLPIYFI